MSATDWAKRAIKRLGLLRAALFVVDRWFDLRPHRVVRRAGILYQLDCRELIDRDICLGAWERETFEFIASSVGHGAIVLEVGANVGAHTLLIAKRVGPSGRVYAFEPTEFARRKLRRNMELNPELADRITVIDALVTDGEHRTPRRAIRSSWRLDARSANATEQVTSNATSLDEFARARSLDRVDILKVDVDGYDLKVLRGATELLERWRPVIYVELCEYALREQGDSVQGVFELLGRFGYSASSAGASLPNASDVLAVIGDGSSMNAVFTAAPPGPSSN